MTLIVILPNVLAIINKNINRIENASLEGGAFLLPADAGERKNHE